MDIEINFSSHSEVDHKSSKDGNVHITTPGSIITQSNDYMSGHGTYKDGDKLVASLSGVVRIVNKLISIQPVKSRYNGEVGDVVVGRVVEVQQKRWKVDINGRSHALLQLSSVNLPAGEQRRKTLEDELQMRSYLQEADLISAEVKNVSVSEGVVSLHTRSLKYGKLSQGILLKVYPSLIRRQKNHFHDLACGVTVILGNNGYIWICPTVLSENGGYLPNLDRVNLADRDTISRLRNCILALSSHCIQLYDTSIVYSFEVSAKYQVGELLRRSVMSEVADLTRRRLEMEQNTHEMQY